MDDDDAAPAMRLRVLVEDKQFDVALPPACSVEDLAHAIEAQYAAAHPRERPLECCLVLDENLAPLQFADTLGETLAPGAVVHAVSRDEGPSDEQLVRFNVVSSRSSSEFDLPSIASGNESTASHTSTPSHADKGSALDVEFRLLLRNQIALRAFKEFLVREFSVENLLFWLDVETYRLCDVDAQTRLQLARRIYINYLSLEAPLQVNVGQDVRHRIDWPQLGVSANVFDDAQGHVYAMMKRHSFRRFLVSPAYKDLEQRILQDPPAFAAAQGTSVVDVFPSVTVAGEHAFIDPAVDVATRDKRDWMLNRSMARYWKEQPTPTAQRYFEDKNKLTALQKQQRIRREKKLHKFFGEKVDAGHDAIERPKSMIEPLETDTSSTRLSISTTHDDDIRGTSTLLRIKRAEKLHNFFGGAVPQRELEEQQIIRSVSAHEVLSASAVDSELDAAAGTDHPERRTSQELTAEERRNLTRRTRKLQDYFGEPAAELRNTTVKPMSSKTATTFTKSKTFLESLFSLGASSSTADSASSSRRQTNASKKGSAEGSSSKPSSPLSPRSFPVPPPSEPALADERQFGSISSLSMPDDPEAIKRTKEYRRRKLLKLQQFLGERLQAEQVEPRAADAPPAAAPTTVPLSSGPREGTPKAKKALTASEKKQQRRKMHKLGRVFGELPPVELIIRPEDSWKERQRKSIEALNRLIDESERDDNSLVDLVLMLREFDEWSKQRIASDADDDAEPLSPSEKRTLQRTMNRKKLSKIKSFFGETPDERLLTAQQVLLDLTESMAEEARDQEVTTEDFEALQKDLEVLKQKIHRRLSVDAGQPGGGAASVPVGRSSFYVVQGSEFTLPPRTSRINEDDEDEDDEDDEDEDEDALDEEDKDDDLNAL